MNTVFLEIRYGTVSYYYINPEVTYYYVCGFVSLCALNTAKNVAYPVRAYGTVRCIDEQGCWLLRTVGHREVPGYLVLLAFTVLFSRSVNLTRLVIGVAYGVVYGRYGHVRTVRTFTDGRLIGYEPTGRTLYTSASTVPCGRAAKAGHLRGRGVKGSRGLKGSRELGEP